MRLVDRYIAHAIWVNILLSLLVLGGMDMLFAFIAELEDISETYRLSDAAVYALATFPRRCYEFMGVSSLMGTLLGLGGLASNSELTVMRAAGISLARIVMAALIPVMCFALVAVLLGQFVIPSTEQYGQTYRSIQQGGGQMLRVKQGNWHREGNEVIHITAIGADGTLHGVKRFRFSDEGELIAMSHAQTAKRESNQWILEQDQTTVLSLSEIKASSSAVLPWASQLTLEMVEMVVSRPEFLSMTRLYSYTRFLKNQGLDNRDYILAFWKKVLQPVATAIMVLIAVSFIFGPLRSVTVGLRIMVGLVVGLVFNYMQDFMVHASAVFSVAPWVAAITPITVFFGVGLLLLRRVR
ncbi:MAG: LPS export ABC transporter permease LptG [Gammaproteobacteria bacterium]